MSFLNSYETLIKAWNITTNQNYRFFELFEVTNSNFRNTKLKHSEILPKDEDFNDCIKKIPKIKKKYITNK